MCCLMRIEATIAGNPLISPGAAIASGSTVAGIQFSANTRRPMSQTLALKKEITMLAKRSRSLMVSAALTGLVLWSASALAAPENFQVQLSGAEQVPAVQSSGTATADLTYDPDT